MNRFVVIFNEVDPKQAARAIQREFGERNHEVAEGVAWVVAASSPALTTADVCRKLGIDTGGHAGVVMRLGDYYGVHDRTLWEKLDLWEHGNG